MMRLQLGCVYLMRNIASRYSSRKALINGRLDLQQKDHYIDGKKIEAKAAVPKNSNNSPTLTRKMFVGGTVSASLVTWTFTSAQSFTLSSLVG